MLTDSVVMVDISASSFSSLVIVFDASMLLCRLLMIWAGVSFRKPGTSSVDFDRRYGLLDESCVCNSFAVAFCCFGITCGWLSVALRILPPLADGCGE